MGENSQSGTERAKAQNNDYSARMTREVHGVDVEVQVFGNELEAERIWMRLSTELEKMQEALDGR